MTSILSGDETVLRYSATGPPELSEVAADAGVTVAAVGPSGAPAIEPLVSVTQGGQTTFHTRCSADELRELTAGLDDGLPTDLADAVVDHDPSATSLPVPDLAGLDAGTRRVTGGWGWRRPTDPDDHEAAGGFVTATAEETERAGESLRGRGWGDWCQDEPLADTWETARHTDGEATVVVNAHGTTADALLLASSPFDVLEGACATARTVDADRVVVYVSEADEDAAASVREAADAYPDLPVAADVVTGPSVYRAAEPTMAIEAVEGNHRLEARLRPPGPAEVGIDGRPTVVHTARTLAQLAHTLRQDGPTTRLVTVTGDVADPVTVELTEGDSLASAVDATTVEGSLKAACVGGRFGGLTASLDVTADPASLIDAGLGTEGVVEVLSESRCVVEFVGRRAQFAADENCGRCVPCREGTTQLAELLRDLYDGRYDRDGIEELDRVMRTSSICTFGVDAGRPARTAMAAFESEFEAHADGRCPAGACTAEVTP
ncbi:NADH-ubiquinone oxidoreductase-F iron-sulfur binding region domain-containing protein [Haloarcula halophila]|uniref:NADH-ubiquinone oxidoreductase-F iron-sulfur binding region domain-containing protein n=1 Tax=Haloarcula TaxID=2237 RepID=UPI0023E44361|nr:NADH-ubiquinone oxidoreductase-F iron-sulfur binding region domain-containing protein [Halomicroarcula sp. DFY41]